MNSFSREDFERGLDHYDAETRVFPRVASKVGSGGVLTKEDVLQILKWKLGRLKGSNAITICDENMSLINQAIKDSGELARRGDALKALLRIPGIGLASATAILTVCRPDQFTIIDWRVLETLDLFPGGLPQERRREHSADSWTVEEYLDEFLPAIQRQGVEWGCELREADRALWGLSARLRALEIINKSNAHSEASSVRDAPLA